MKNKFYFLSAAIFIISIALPFFVMAQDPGGDVDTPLDGGIGLLLAAGIAYGVRKYREGRKATGNKEQAIGIKG